MQETLLTIKKYTRHLRNTPLRIWTALFFSFFSLASRWGTFKIYSAIIRCSFKDYLIYRKNPHEQEENYHIKTTACPNAASNVNGECGKGHVTERQSRRETFSGGERRSRGERGTQLTWAGIFGKRDGPRLPGTAAAISARGWKRQIRRSTVLSTPFTSRCMDSGRRG